MTLINGPGRGRGAGGSPLYKLIYRIKISRMSPNKMFMFLITPASEIAKMQNMYCSALKKEKRKTAKKKILYLLAIYG